MRFADRPLKAKLMLIIGVTVGAGLAISTLLFAASEINDNRESELSKLTGMAEILAASVAIEIGWIDFERQRGGDEQRAPAQRIKHETPRLGCRRRDDDLRHLQVRPSHAQLREGSRR